MSKKILIILICVLAVALVGELVFVGYLNNREQPDQQTQPGTTLPAGNAPAPGQSQEGAQDEDDASIDPSIDPSESPAVVPTVDPSGDPSVDPSVDPSTDPSTDPSAP